MKSKNGEIARNYTLFIESALPLSALQGAAIEQRITHNMTT
ncbi:MULTISPECIES: hypothetical protein [unclassified Paenibacillus]